jgi:hypothetical protein
MSDDNVWTDTWGTGEDWSGGDAPRETTPARLRVGRTVYEPGPGELDPLALHTGS